MKTGTLLRMAVVVLAMTFSVSLASAQLNSAAQPITLNAKLTESLSINLSASAVISAYVVTSAKNDNDPGVPELIERIKNTLPWDRLTATTTTRTFKRIKEHVL